jgi:hypothetical protein
MLHLPRSLAPSHKSWQTLTYFYSETPEEEPKLSTSFELKQTFGSAICGAGRASIRASSHKFSWPSSLGREPVTFMARSPGS